MKYFSFLVFLFISLFPLRSQVPFPDPGPVFRDDVIPRIDILIPEDSLVALFLPENLESDHHYLADFIFDNGTRRDTVYEVGFRLRGNTSRYSQKKSFKVSFNTYAPGRKFFGLEKLNLNGEHNDPSVTRAKICWDLLREMEIPAPRSNHINLYVNGIYFGLYINVEHIDEEFVDLRFGNKNGNLYKCLYPADLDFRGSQPDAYKHMSDGRRVYDLITNQETDDYSDLAHFIDVLNNTAANDLACELDQVLNIDNMIRAIAFDILSGNWDGPLYNKNNFYLYHNSFTGKFEYIPYDLDNTLGIDWLGQNWGTRNIYEWAKHNEARPLFYTFLSVPEHRERLSYYLDSFIDQFFNETFLFSYIDSIRSQITWSAANDPFRPLDYGFTLQDFLNSFQIALDPWHVQYGLKPYITTRKNTALGQLETYNISPVIRNPGYVADYEQGTLVFSVQAEDESVLPSVNCCIRRNDNESFDCLSLYDDGNLPDQKAGDGVFTGTYSPDALSGTFYYYMESVDVDQNTYRYPVCREESIEFGSDIGLKINELMADNEGSVSDPAGEYDDWLELYNTGQESIFLGDKYLTDDRQKPLQWKLPNIWLEPGHFLLVWADDQEEQGDTHASFKLSKGGEFLGIYDKAGTEVVLLDGIDFENQEEDISFGRYPDGTGSFMSLHPTPGGSNQPLEVSSLSSSSLRVYPNPAGDYIHIENLPGRIGSVTVYNPMGVPVAGLNPVWIADDEFRMDIGFLPPGLYYLDIEAAGRPWIRSFWVMW